MRIGDISFCDKIGYNIRSDETKKQILDKLEKKYGIRIIARHYDKFDPVRSVPVLNRNPHMICARSNGNPYMLYLTRYNFVDICIFIDKKVQQGYFLPRMIVAHLMIGAGAVHDDTVMHGEMIKKNDGSWVFAINDMTVYKGRLLSEENLVKRLNYVYALLESEYIEDDMTPFKIVVKKFFAYDEAEALDSHIKDLPYTCRGLYFKPLFIKFRDILLNFDDALVKKVERYKVGGTFMLNAGGEAALAPPPTVPPPSMTSPKPTPNQNQNQTQFYTKKTSAPDVYDIFDEHGVAVGIACIPTLALSKKMRLLFETKTIIDKLRLPYTYSDKFNKWVPLV
jgi:hypothetical protein